MIVSYLVFHITLCRRTAHTLRLATWAFEKLRVTVIYRLVLWDKCRVTLLRSTMPLVSAYLQSIQNIQRLLSTILPRDESVEEESLLKEVGIFYLS